MTLEIQVDRDSCRGARACVRRAPGTFSLDGHGKSTAAAEPLEDEGTIRAAATACPFFAISVRETAAR